MSDTSPDPIEQRAFKTRAYHLDEFNDANKVAEDFTNEIRGLLTQAVDTCVEDQRVIRSIHMDWMNIRDQDMLSKHYNPDGKTGFWHVVVCRTKGFGPLDYHSCAALAPSFIKSPSE